MSFRPCHFSGSGRSAFVKSWNECTSTVGSPRRGLELGPLDADHVAWIEVGKKVECFRAKDVATREELDPACAVLQISERGPAVQPFDHHPAGKGPGVGSIAFPKQRPRMCCRVRWLETARGGIDAGLAKALELLAAVAHLVGEIDLGLVGHGQRLTEQSPRTRLGAA